MKNPIIFIGIIAIFCSCSSTNLMSLSVMEPAPVSLPSNIKSIAIVNRSQASDQTKVFDAIHKALSLETAGLQREGAKASIRGLTDELQKNNRFTEVKYLNDLDLRTFGAGIFPNSLEWDSVEKICRENNVDALFALELFDTESKLTYGNGPANVINSIANIANGTGNQVNMVTQEKTN